MLLDLTTASVVEWSRWQFALTAIYHYMFVPLTLGLALMIAIMESVWVKTRDKSWLNATKFWMKLFGINFAIGVATGLILEFQFGTNWSNYFWSSFGDRRNLGILFGVDLRGRHVFRVGESQQTLPSDFHLDGIRRSQHFGPVDFGGERLDAKSGGHGVQSNDSPQRNGKFLGRVPFSDSH